MSEENVEVARRLYSEQPMDLVPVFSDPELLDAVRAQVEPLVHPDFETLAAPAALSMEGAPDQPLWALKVS